MAQLGIHNMYSTHIGAIKNILFYYVYWYSGDSNTSHKTHELFNPNRITIPGSGNGCTHNGVVIHNLHARSPESSGKWSVIVINLLIHTYCLNLGCFVEFTFKHLSYQ